MHHHRSHIGVLAMAAAMAAAGPLVRVQAPVANVPRAFPSWKHDPERLAAAEAKRARKNAKRLRDARGY
jgi:hypothetical protein